MIFDKLLANQYRASLFTRYDNPYGIFYFSAADFPGLQAHPYSFPAQAGHTLKGYFYHYDRPIPGRLLVFDHGLGNGHRAYMTEIELLARAGFLVFSYDHTGCMESGGESTNGFGQSLQDLDACITALKAEPALSGRAFSVMGHSWGGFSTMNIAALHPEITHVVSMSGLVSVERMVNQMIGRPTRFYRWGGFSTDQNKSDKPLLDQIYHRLTQPYCEKILEIERSANPASLEFDAVDSLRNTDAKVLLIYSSNDSVVNKAHHYDVLQRELKDRPRVRLLLVDNKDHNPHYTEDAVAYKTKFFNDFNKAVSKKQLVTVEQQAAFMAKYDWRRMTAQDPAVWAAILDTLK